MDSEGVVSLPVGPPTEARAARGESGRQFIVWSGWKRVDRREQRRETDKSEREGRRRERWRARRRG